MIALKKLLKFANVKYFSTYSISEILKNKPSETICVKGWIQSIRKMKDKIFLDLTDGSCNDKLQIVIPKSLANVDLNSGASLEINGTLTENKNQQFEIKANSVDIIGDCNVTDGYPFVPKQSYNTDYLRQYLHFRPRVNKFASLLRVRHSATLALHEYFYSQGFILINTPILTSNDCEGAGEIFAVQPVNDELVKAMANKSIQDRDEIFFNRKTFLTVSGQMHLESAAHALSKVYTLGPTFRAENSKSRLHLSEFYMLEAEMAFLNSLDQLLSHVEHLLKSITLKVLNNSSSDIFSLLDNKDFLWLDNAFPVMKYDEVVNILKSKFNTFDENLGLSKENEHFLVEYNNNMPTFVVDWPKKLKPFYMKSSENDQVAAFDLLVPNVGELVGGSLRENDYNILKANIPSDTNLDWYLELRKFGGVPTGGYGMGFERYLQFLLNIPNIKDTIPFPRWPHNCSM